MSSTIWKQLSLSLVLHASRMPFLIVLCYVFDLLHDKRSKAIMSNEYWIYRGGGVCIMMALSVLVFVHQVLRLLLLHLSGSSCAIASKLKTSKQIQLMHTFVGQSVTNIFEYICHKYLFIHSFIQIFLYKNIWILVCIVFLIQIYWIFVCIKIILWEIVMNIRKF